MRQLHKVGSLWFPLSRRPRLQPEAVIAYLARVLDLDPVVEGAEWWWQHRDTSEGMGFHFDKDEELHLNEGVYRHPVHASILYMDSAPGPTLVANITPTQREQPTRVVGVHPQANAYVLFPGSLLHGVAAEPAGAVSRQTFLINWWNRKPGSRHCSDPPCQWGGVDALKVVPWVACGPPVPTNLTCELEQEDVTDLLG